MEKTVTQQRLNERYSPRDNDISGKTEWLNSLTVTLVFNQTSWFLIDQIIFTQVRYRYNRKPLLTEPQRFILAAKISP